MTQKIDFHSGRLKRAYEQDKNFYNILSGLSLATLIALISIVDDTNKNEVKHLSLETRGYVSVALDSKAQIDESNDELLKEQDLEAEEGEDLTDADNLLEENNGDSLESYSVDKFKVEFNKHFEPERQQLINKYSEFFGSEKLDFEVYKDFVLEFSFAQSVAIRKAQRDLGWNSLSDEQINESVKSLKEKFLESFDSKFKRVLNSREKLKELENILNESNYIDVQPSLFDVYDSEVNGGNCVARALETTLLLEALSERLGARSNFDAVGLLLMPGHIVATASNQMKGETTLVDSSNSVLKTQEIGKIYTGGQKMQVILGDLENKNPNKNPNNKPNDSKNGSSIEGSPYLGSNPSGEVSKVDQKEYSQTQQRLVQRKFNQQLSKYIEGISVDEKETLELNLSMISNPKLKNEYLRFLESGGDSSKFLKSKQMQILRSNGIGSEITIDDLKRKGNSLKDFFELFEMDPVSETMRIRLDSAAENEELNKFNILFHLDLNPSPKTLVGIKTDVVDISRLEDLSELLRQNKIQEDSKEDQKSQDLQELDSSKLDLELVDPSLESQGYHKEQLDVEESRRIPELYIAKISRYQFKKLAQMDLSRVKTVFQFDGGVSFNDFKNLDGFNGIITLHNFQVFDLKLLKSVDLSNATFSLEYLSFNELRFLLQANVGQFLIPSVSILQDIVENDLYTLNPDANFVIDESLKDEPEFKVLSRQAKYKAFLRSFKM